MAMSILLIAKGYLAVGALVALLFALFGVARVDAGAKGSWPLFRLLVIPGATLLWPLVLVRWFSALRGRA